MGKEYLNALYEALNKFITDYQGKVSVENAQQVIKEFDEQWIRIFDYPCDKTADNQSKYGIALEIYSCAVNIMFEVTEKCIEDYEKLIKEYDSNANSKYHFENKQALYFNLGLYWHKVGRDNKAIDAFKKYVFYLIAHSYNKTYQPITAYMFKKCNERLFKLLVNEALNLSSPTTFNDPFDCPIISLMELPINDGDVSKLIQKAYIDCTKIACFSRNVKLPYLNVNNEPILNEKKRGGDKEEYLNDLMWAHYTDYHKGICIKYCFNNSIPQLIEDGNAVASFKDVVYSDRALISYTHSDAMSLKDAFFLKGKNWEYENELRYLYYDLNSDSTHKSINIPNSIQAIYFGLKCSSDDVKIIKNLMKDKNLSMQKETRKMFNSIK